MKYGLTSPSHDSLASPLGRKRRPLGTLTSLVNTLDRRLLRGSRLARSVLQMCKPSEYESEDDNDTTLVDQDPPLPIAPPRRPMPDSLASIRRTQLLYDDPSQFEQVFRGSNHLDQSAIRTFRVSQDLLPRIDEHEMHRIVLGEHAGQFDEFVIIDCRFPYEYTGGHISGAINIVSQGDLERQLVEQYAADGRKKLLIFHCEYLIFRGPTMAGHLRKLDRVHNADCYPHLLYPDIVVLEGGYKRFFDTYLNWCTPQAYVEMKDSNHRQTCEVEMNKVLQSTKLTRAKLLNQFQPHLNHLRSASFSLLSDPGTAHIRRQRSGKIYKKGREFRLSQLILNLDSTESDAEDDFAPPPALFREHSKSLSAMLLHLLLLLVCSEADSSFSLSELLVESPFTDDYLDSQPPTKLFLFPPKNKARLTVRTSKSRSHHLAFSLPTLSSPLTSSFEAHDIINDTPVDFAWSGGRLLSFLGGFNSVSSVDIDEVDEETD